METFCEIYEAIDSVQLELFRLLDKIFNNAKTKSNFNSFILKVEQRRMGHYPMVKLERVQFPNIAEVSSQIKVEANVNSDRYLDTIWTLELEPAESEALSSMSSNNFFHHSADILSTDVKSEKIRMDFEPGCVTMSKFKTEPNPVFENEAEKQAKWKGGWRHRNKKHQCLFCPSKYAAPSMLEIHIKTHTRETPYICRICLEEFKQRRTFLNHCRRHFHRPSANKTQTVRKRLFQCHLCERRYFNRPTLRLHHKCVHSNERPFSCDICGAKFKLKTTLQRHQRFLHSDQKIKLTTKCPLCPERFTSRTSLRNHCLAVHPKESLSYTCKFCGNSFFPKSVLNKHVKMVHEKGFKCKLCGQEGLSTVEEWRQHLKTLHPDDCTFKCSYDGCDWTSYGNTDRKLHILTHSREKLVHCDHCQKWFGVKKLLEHHTKNKTCHGVENSLAGPARNRNCQYSGKAGYIFNCNHPGCDWVFNRKSKLETHRLCRHSKERNFQCNYCKMTFSTKYALEIHSYVHKETQPFVCGQCGKGFAVKSRLNDHMKAKKHKKLG